MRLPHRNTVLVVASWTLVVLFVIVAFGYQSSAYDHAQAENAELTRQLAELETVLPELQACRDAAETGELINRAWHQWAGDETTEHAELVNELQSLQARQLDRCRRDLVDA